MNWLEESPVVEVLAGEVLVQEVPGQEVQEEEVLDEVRAEMDQGIF
jgi:hypothetical protein